MFGIGSSDFLLLGSGTSSFSTGSLAAFRFLFCALIFAILSQENQITMEIKTILCPHRAVCLMLCLTIITYAYSKHMVFDTGLKVNAFNRQFCLPSERILFESVIWVNNTQWTNQKPKTTTAISSFVNKETKKTCSTKLRHFKWAKKELFMLRWIGDVINWIWNRWAI